MTYTGEKRREYSKKRYWENRDAELERSRRWAADNPDKAKARNRNYKANNPEKWAAAHRKSRLKRDFGITPEQFDALLEEQNGLCAVCGKTEVGKALAVDHHHETGQVRGLLCTRCNPGLGFFQDDKTLLSKAITYLERYDS